MKEVSVTVFGSKTTVTSSGCTCGGPGPSMMSMKEDAEDLKKYLEEKFGDKIKFNYVDVQSDEMKDYPDIKDMLSRVRLPLTVIDGEPTFHGGLSLNKIAEVINKKLTQ